MSLKDWRPKLPEIKQMGNAAQVDSALAFMVAEFHNQPHGPQVPITATTGENTSTASQTGRCLYSHFRVGLQGSKLLLPCPSLSRSGPKWTLKMQPLPAAAAKKASTVDQDSAGGLAALSTRTNETIVSVFADRLAVYYNSSVMPKLKVCLLRAPMC